MDSSSRQLEYQYGVLPTHLSRYKEQGLYTINYAPNSIVGLVGILLIIQTHKATHLTTHALSGVMPTTYKAEPAEPILAHTLLQTSARIRQETGSASNQVRPDQDLSIKWNLELDIGNGLYSSPDSIFRPGTVIGFSRLRGRSPDGNDDEFVGEVRSFHCISLLYVVLTPPSSPAISSRNGFANQNHHQYPKAEHS